MIDQNLNQTLYAHSQPNQRTKENWQPLIRHLLNVAEEASRFAASFGSADWGWVAGLLHDLGKAAPQFQAYLERENEIDDPEYDETIRGRINHSSAGAALTVEWYNKFRRPFGTVLSYLIAGHHAGLPDYDGGNGALDARLRDGLNHIQISAVRNFIGELEKFKRPLTQFPAAINKANFHLWIRLLFSCLVDADYLDTEKYLTPSSTKLRRNYPPLSQLKSKLDKHLSYLSQTSNDSNINAIRRQILSECRTRAKDPAGIFTLTVPTGGGKTLSALSFALDHASMQGKERVIYVIPYTSIIEQTADILAAIFGRENIVEHHSNLEPDKETIRSTLASENWDAPLIVTTSVQFFESLFAARPSKCRKLHNLANSVIIIDEAQLLPPDKIKPCNRILDDLVELAGATILLSTATQPTIPDYDSCSSSRIRTEIISKELDLYVRLKRTEIKFPELIQRPADWTEISKELQQQHQVLCIVNTRSDCYSLAKLMPPDTVHLSALMCGEHRSKVIKFIKNELTQKRSIRVVSTQLVEAGVDIDFPIVFRAISGLDSIVQAAGRCNREGANPALGQVNVFFPPKQSPRGLLRKGEDTTIELASSSRIDWDDSQVYKQYFELFYSKVNSLGEAVIDDLKIKDPTKLDLQFRSVADKFRFIDDTYMTPILVRYDNGEKLIEELRQTGPNRTLLRKLQRFTVNISTQTKTTLFESGLIEEVAPGYFAQSQLGVYDDRFGYIIFEQNISPEELIL